MLVGTVGTRHRSRSRVHFQESPARGRGRDGLARGRSWRDYSGGANTKSPSQYGPNSNRRFQSPSQPRSNVPFKGIRCYNCQQTGHLARDCPQNVQSSQGFLRPIVSARSKATVTAPHLKRWRAVSHKKNESQTTDQECDPCVTSWKEEQRRWEIATAKCPHRPRNIASIGLLENHLRYNISMLGNQLCAMVDSGASRNFLSTKVAKRIGVQQRKLARAYTAVVANGGKLKITSHATLDIAFDGKLTNSSRLPHH